MLLSSLYAVVSISIVTVIATAIYTAFFLLLYPLCLILPLYHIHFTFACYFLS